MLFLLQSRFLSIPKGFSYLNERGYVSKQMEKWHKVHPWDFHWHISNTVWCGYMFSSVFLQEYNLKYVDLIEEQLNEALTTYRKPVDGDNYVRRSNQR